MPNNTVFTTSKGIVNNRAIKTLLGCNVERYKRTSKNVKNIICWGFKPTSRKAEQVAEKLNATLIRLEDGFITTLPSFDGQLSICVDAKGMHYKDTSSIHKIIETKRSDQEIERARTLIAFKNKNYITKYNDTGVYDFNELKAHPRNNVLILDQVANDQSVISSGCTQTDFEKMILDAIRDFPDSRIFIKKHPDSKKKQTFTSRLSIETRAAIKENHVELIDFPINAIQLIEQISTVYTISSLMGFEAALMNKEVVVYGTPFYAGYGFTKDIKAVTKAQKSKEEVFYGAYIDYCRYLNPISNKTCTIEETMEVIALNIKVHPKSKVIVKTPKLWKRSFLRSFLKNMSIHKITFNKRFYNASWGYDNNSAKNNVFIEDGFIRSKGLGSSLEQPCSLAIESSGIYYDHNSNSELEQILNNHDFTNREIERSKMIISELVNSKLTKYNLQPTPMPEIKDDYVLVVGQVEQDKSILASGNGFTNADAVRIAKERFPNFVVVYKPHPDVVHNKINNQNEEEASNLADIVVKSDNIIELLDACKCLVTITSNTGFEALIRGIPVYCLGFPYYYGWGLTIDEIKLPQRSRQRSVEEVAAATLILYPTYFEPNTKLFARPEEIMQLIKKQPFKKAAKAAWPLSLYYKLKNWAN